MPDSSQHSSGGLPSLKELAVEKAGALHPEDSVESAGHRMREHGTSAWPVAEDRKLVGMVDNQNPDWQISGRVHDPKASEVRDIMNRNVLFCYEDEDCGHARELMDKHGLSYLPVVDRSMRIVGIFSRDEIQKKAQQPATAGAATLQES